MDGASPSAEQRARLLDWPGWGPLAPAFAPSPAAGWLDVADLLDTMFMGHMEDLAAAAELLDTSFYTPHLLVDQVFHLLRASGFTGGRVLEPGCGSGRFMSWAPSDLDISWIGVEADPTAAAIARALNPSAEIITGKLEATTLRAGHFDAAVANVPFSATRVHDAARPESHGLNLHRYFILRALEAVRVGGLVVAIISRHFVDGLAASTSVNQLGRFVTAVRLPSGAFASTGTDVVADLVVLQRTSEGGAQPPAAQHLVTESARPDVISSPVTVSNHWGDRPDLVAGRMQLTGWSRSPITVASDSPDDDIRAAVATATLDVPSIPPRDSGVDVDLAGVILSDEDGRKEGSFHVVRDVVHQVVDGALITAKSQTRELHRLIALRDAALRLLELEADTALADSALDATRAEALNLYHDYVSKHGPLNRGNVVSRGTDEDTGLPKLSYTRPAMGGFRWDPDYTTVLALEVWDQEKGEAEPAPILLRRVNRAPERVESAASPAEALSIARGEGAGVDLERIRGLLDLSTADDALAALGGLVFRDPRSGDWTARRDYLSGNVRVKLEQAREAAARDDQFERNVDALVSVVPADLGPLEIRVGLGAPWVAPDYVAQFAAEVFGRKVSVDYTPVVSYWDVTLRGSGSTVELAKDISVAPDVRIRWGTVRVGPYKLLEDLLNGRPTIITDPVRRGDRMVQVKNHAETLAADERQQAIQERFSTWVWEDADRAASICAEYNARFNSYVTQRPDGSHLRFPGLANGFTLWPHQRDAVDAIMSNARYMVAHSVGAGKTTDFIVAAVTMKRNGIASKPAIAVPNHLLEQVAREARQLYPTGRFLVAGKDDLRGKGRRLFAARCATGDWDAVIMTHQALTSMPVSDEAEEAFIEQQKADLDEALRQRKSNQNTGGGKAIARAKRALETRLRELRDDDRRDAALIRFEQLGIDHLSVDEAHAYKRLPITTRVDGFSLGSSKRATDLLLKIELLAERRPGRPVVAMFTGTPWSNTIAETYVWQVYLQPWRLEEMGVRHFDAWASTFVRFETRVEVTPDGSGFRMQRRPAVIQNYPELRTAMAEVIDMLPSEALQLERPEADAANIAVEASAGQRAFVEDLARRADEIRAGEPRQFQGADGEPYDDNMLLICTDGRKVALDPKLVSIDEQSSKLAALAQNVALIYRDGLASEYGGGPGHLQLVLADLGTPNAADSQTYGRAKAAIVAAGVPADAVRFVHEAKTDKARDAMFQEAREGKIAVLFGSTEKVGTGTNVQRRLRAIHHLDMPWRHSDMEQRNGRGIRPGNLNARVAILTYITIGSFDAYMGQLIEKKARFVTQLFRLDVTEREIEDIADVVLSYGEIKAIAAGNPLLMEHASARAEVKRLRLMETLHVQSIRAAVQQADRDERTAMETERDTILLRRLAGLVRPADSTESGVIDIAEAVAEGRVRDCTYRGVTLSQTTVGQTGGHDVPVRVTASGNIVWQFVIPKRVVRRSAQAVAAFLAPEIDAWMAGLSNTIEQNQARIVRLRSSVAAARHAAETMTFEQSGALRTAEQKLATIEAALEDAAEIVGGDGGGAEEVQPALAA